jgi:hypothetical protein
VRSIGGVAATAAAATEVTDEYKRCGWQQEQELAEVNGERFNGIDRSQRDGKTGIQDEGK